MEERIRDIQKYLNDIRHNLVTLRSDRSLEYVPYFVLENTNELLNVVDEKLTEIKKLLAEQKTSNK